MPEHTHHESPLEGSPQPFNAPPSEGQSPSQFCDPLDLVGNGSREVSPSAAIDDPVECTAVSGEKRLGRKRKQQRPFGDLFAQLDSVTGDSAKKRTRREILVDTIDYIGNLQLTLKSLQTRLASGRSESIAPHYLDCMLLFIVTRKRLDQQLKKTDMPSGAPGSTSSDNSLQSQQFNPSYADYSHTIGARELEAWNLEREEPESEAAILLSLLPQADAVARSPSRCLSISELIL